MHKNMPKAIKKRASRELQRVGSPPLFWCSTWSNWPGGHPIL